MHGKTRHCKIDTINLVTQASPMGPPCTNSSHTSSSDICSAVKTPVTSSRKSRTRCACLAVHAAVLLQPAQQSMLHLRVQVADVHRRLLVSVLGMLPDEIGTDAGGDAPASSRHGRCRLETPFNAPICRARCLEDLNPPSLQ
jgi:hypothetical protein